MGERGASLLGADEWYREKFFDVFLPRILSAGRLGDLSILVPPTFQEIEGFRDLPPRCHVIPCRDGTIGEALAMDPLGTGEAVLLLHPFHLLVSPVEIDRLVGFHESSKGGYSANHRPARGNNYPTGIGAEIVSGGPLHRLLGSPIPPRRDEACPGIPETDPADGPRAPQECSGPEITLSCGSPEGYAKLRTLIATLEKARAGPLWDVPHILKTYRTLNHLRTAILLEDDADVERAAAWARGAGGEITFISLHPYCSYALEKRGVPHRTMIDYYDPDRFNRIGQDNFRRVEIFCTEVDRDPALGSSWQVPTSVAAFALKILFDVVILKSHVLHNLIEKERPDTIVIFSRYPKGHISPPLPFSYEDPLFGMIAALPGWPVPLTDLSLHEDRPVPPDLPRRQGLVSAAKQILRKNPALFNAAVILNSRGVVSLWDSFKNALQGTRNALIYESGYNWDDALPELYAAGFRRILRIFDSDLGNTSEGKGTDPLIMGTISRALPYAGIDPVSPVDLTPLLVPKLAEITGYSKNEARAAYNQVLDLIQKRKIHCLLLSTRATPKGIAVVLAAGNQGIPVISWQHGAGGLMDHPIMLEVELRGSTTHLVFGEGVARSYSRMLEKYAVQDPPDIIPVGSSSVDRIAREAARPTGHRKHKRILYVTTSYLLNTWYISFVRREFDENLWQVQRDILRVFAEHPENEYIIKLHPGHSSRKPIADYLEDIGLTNVRLIVKEERIEDLYDWADNILLDLISTSILQVCTTEKPIHVYSGLYQYDREVIRLLAKRASVYEEKDEFIEGVKQAVQGHETTVVDPGNKEFLECFGTHLSDGRAAQRASEVVRDVLLRK